MLTSICPLGERARRQPYLGTVAAYIVASVVAAAALGALAALLGSALDDALHISGSRTAVAALALGAAIGLVFDLRAGDGPLPGPARQVDDTWMFSFRGWVYGAGFGAQLGTGVTTYVVTSATYLVWLAAALSASVTIGIALGCAYALARALPVLVMADVRDGVTLRARMRKLYRFRPIVHRVLLATQAGVMVAGAGLAAGLA